tara:strand:+ start:310 stop:891 length:582 start_codon:yes stop_codon:yes gene_type:complete
MNRILLDIISNKNLLKMLRGYFRKYPLFHNDNNPKKDQYKYVLKYKKYYNAEKFINKEKISSGKFSEKDFQNRINNYNYNLYYHNPIMITQPIIISKYKKNTVTGHNDEHVIKLNVVEIYTGNKFINNEKKCDVNFTAQELTDKIKSLTKEPYRENINSFIDIDFNSNNYILGNINVNHTNDTTIITYDKFTI